MVSIIITILALVANWMIFKKMGREGWEGIVPFYNTYVLCQELYGNGWKMLLLLIPFYNIYFYCKMWVDLSKAFNLGGAFAVGLILMPFIFGLILGFGSAQYKDGSKANTTADFVTNAVEKTKTAAAEAFNAAENLSKGRGWKCPSCGGENTSNAAFCVHCGTPKPQPKFCPKCGARLESDMTFCPDCGAEYYDKTQTVEFEE